MSVGEIRLGDIGTEFLITLKDQDSTVIDISSADTLQVIFKKPSCELLTKTATLKTDGTDGKMYYNSISGDLDEAGVWKIQGSVVFGGSSWKTDITTFRVYDNIT